MKLKTAKPEIGDVVKINSSDWYVWNGDRWFPIIGEDQLEENWDKEQWEHLSNCEYLQGYDYLPNLCDCGSHKQIGFVP